MPIKRDPGRLYMTKVKNGLLVQTDAYVELDKSKLKVVTKKKPTEEELDAMVFGVKICRHIKSNTILLVKGVKEVEALAIEGRSAIENPPPLENREFGIRLIAAEIPAKTTSNKTLGQVLGLKPPVVAPHLDPTAGSLLPETDSARTDSPAEESLPHHPPSG